MKLRDRHAISLAGAAVVLALGAAVGCTEVSTGGPLFTSNGDWIPDPGQIVEEARPVGNVTGVILDGVGTVHVTQAGFSELRVRAPVHVQPRLRTEMFGSTLVISLDPGPALHSSLIEYHLTVAQLERAELIGAGAIRSTHLATGDLTLIKSGVGEIDLQGLSANRINVTQTGLGLVRLAGSADRQVVSVDGLGDYEAVGLASQEADLTLHSSASARVQVANRLNAAIHGSGSVYYYGNPVITRTGGGSGTVVGI